MKFRDLKTGEVMSIETAFEEFCGKRRCDDNSCELGKEVPHDYEECFSWVWDNPEKAANIMGYEYVQDHFRDPTKMINSKDPSTEKLQYINSVYGADEILCQAAEESVELAKACDDLKKACMKLTKATLKLRRAQRGTTPVSLTEATRNVLEECADVSVCIGALEVMGVFTKEELGCKIQEKLERWSKRAEEYKGRNKDEN